MKKIFNKIYLSFLVVFALISFNCEIFAQNTAKLYIMRKQTVALVKPDISVNDIEVGNLPNKKYIECIVPTGKVSVTAYCLGSTGQINFVAESGKTYYIKTNVNPKGGVSGIDYNSSNGSSNLHVKPSANVECNLKLTQMMGTDGEKLLKKCKQQLFADMTEYSSPMSNALAQTDNISGSTNLSSNTGNGFTSNNTTIENKQRQLSDVDINIPVTNIENNNTFVLIIANENYSFVDNVQYAKNDGNTFREYCIKTLGIPERQIWLYEDASLGIISSGVNKMVQAMQIFPDARAIIYYCGHGIPDDKNGDAYIIPVDGKGTDLTSCYSLNKLYKTMADAKTSNVTYFMDACFSGANRDGSMLVAARGVAREPKKEVLTGKTVVFSAASSDETAMPFKEKGHGLFTYFLLKKLQESKGNVKYGELADYINENVKKEAFLTNEKPQNPVVSTSEGFESSWKELRINKE